MRLDGGWVTQWRLGYTMHVEFDVDVDWRWRWRWQAYRDGNTVPTAADTYRDGTQFLQRLAGRGTNPRPGCRPSHSRSLVWLALPDRLKRMKAQESDLKIVDTYVTMPSDEEGEKPRIALVAGYDFIDGPNGEVIRLSQIVIYLAKK